MYSYVIDNITRDWNEIPEYSILTSVEQPFFVKGLKAIDLFYAKWVNHRNKKSYGVYPMIAYQHAGFSTIEIKHVDYSASFDQRAKTLASNIQCKFIGLFEYDLEKYSKTDIIKKHKYINGPYDFILVCDTANRKLADIVDIQETDIYVSNLWDVYYFSNRTSSSKIRMFSRLLSIAYFKQYKWDSKQPFTGFVG